MVQTRLVKPLAVVALICMPIALVAQGAQTPSRFQLLARDSVAEVSGLSLYTIRDDQLSQCYLLFTTDQPSAAAPPAAPSVTPPSRAARPPGPAGPSAWATLPTTTPTPGSLTGGWEYLAESMRLALVHPSTAAALTAPLDDRLADLAERLGRIESALKDMPAPPRLAVLPVACSAPPRKQ